MNKFLLRTTFFLNALLLAFLSVPASAQTVALSDGTVLQSKTNRVGLNIGSINYYDNGQILKNLVGALNPGFEPMSTRQIWALSSEGTTTTFQTADIYDLVPPNYFAGATFTVVASQLGGAELGCTGTISSNTGPNYPGTNVTTWVAPTFTASTPCAAPFNVGDLVVLTQSSYPTPNSWYMADGGGGGGFWASASNGGQFETDTTDLCATCGKQSLEIDATASGSTAAYIYYYDGAKVDGFVMMNGTYQFSFWAKAAAGTPATTVSIGRLATGGFSCPNYTPTLTSTWTQYTFSCTAAETASGTALGPVKISIQTTGGAMYLDNVSFVKTSPTINNPTVLRDEVVETLQKYFGNGAAGPAGVFRFWLGQNGETLDNWTSPDYEHGATAGGSSYMVGPGGGGTQQLSLEDYLVICQYLNAEPYLEVPVTFSASEASGLIDFLAGSSSTTYGARRVALGQTTPWTQVFDKIHLSFCNECWNSFTFGGQSLGYRSTYPSDGYHDYGVRSAAIFSAMREDSNYNASSFDLVMNAQTAVNAGMDWAIQNAAPDSIEIEEYMYPTVTSFATDSALWAPAFIEPYQSVSNPADPSNFYQSLQDYQSQKTCGANGNAACHVNIYEWGQGTTMGTIDQTHLDYINAGAGQGVITALQPLLNMQQFGILPQSYFSLTEFQNGSQITGETTKIWGNVVDMGGDTNNVRPGFLGVQLANQSIIGPMYSCPINNNPTYNFPASTNGFNGATPAQNSVPYMFSFCFENGLQRSMVLVNTDLVNSYTVNFSGTNTPSGTVTQRQYAPTSLDALNEGATGTSAVGVPENAFIATSTLTNPASVTLPPHSVTALDFTAAALPIASTPSFSPAAGGYTSAQTVTISDANLGTTIYYTTDGSTPTTSSNLYTGPITVGVNETVRAIAVETNFTNSSVASAAYIIAPPVPTPTFSVAAGTYTTPQAVAINDTLSGATVYYTTNGTTPTTSSAVYSGPITVGANETLEALATGVNYTNSTVASSAYVIAPVIPTPTFSLSAGTYGSAQTLTLTDAQPGVSIYYTINGLTPSAVSPLYTGPITVNSTETVEAIAIASGYTNSSVATAAYTISGTTAYISILGGGFNASSFDLNGGASVISGGILQITDGGTAETRSAWYATQVPVNNFVTDFTFQQLNPVANGMTFTIQNAGTTALGTAGAGLGYQNIGTSVAVKFDLYNSAGQGTNTTGLFTDGAIPTVPAVSLSTTAVNLLSAHIMDAHLVYDGTNLTMTLTDTVTGAATTQVFPVNIPSLVGASKAYVGFTGGTGGKTVTQNILSWSYVNAGSGTTTPVAATPAFSVAAGTYTTAQTVAISDATAGTTIYYTTNGTTPTTSSSVYSGPIAVSATETLEAIAVETGYTTSAAASAAYTIAPVLPMPSFSLAPGTYTSSQSVTISASTTTTTSSTVKTAATTAATTGTTVYYTTNGTTPTTASSVYSGPINVDATETLQAISVATGYTNSPVAAAAYTIATTLPTPAFSVAAGTYTTAQTVAISDATAGTTIYYTTNGTTPTTSSSVYSGPIAVSATETLEAIAVETGYTTSAAASAAYTINPVLPTPAFSVAAGTYTTAQTVAISDATAGTTIYYTTNGSTPTTSSSVYSGPITVSATETLEAIAVETGYTTSAAASAAYTINPVLPAPAFSVAAGTYTTAQTVAISDATAGTTIYYTTNGSTPTTSSSVYSAAIAVSASETLEAIAVKTGYTTSAAASAVYTINPVLPTPAFSVAAGTYTTAQTVTISDATAGATIYYTTNGTTPTTSSSVYSGPITVSVTETLTAIAVETGYTNSAVASAAYTLTPLVATPTFSIAAGSYTAAQTVTIGETTPGTTIYYTTNGTTPTTASDVYGSAISVGATETLQAMAVATGYANSPVASATYTITTPTTTYISLASGKFAASSFDLNGGATVTSAGLLQVTDGGESEARSAWYSTQVPVQNFVTDFTFQLVNPNADGMTFTIQAAGSTALGSAGGGLGYQGIAKSVAVKFDLHNNAGEGSDSTGLYLNGAVPEMPAVNLSSTAINLHSGDTMHAHLVYDGSNLTMTLTDTVTNGTVTEVFPVNIPAAVGGNTAWVGFTGGTGGNTATQNVLTWTYTSTTQQTTGAALTAPVFTPAAGTYASAQSVTIADATSGATIYYTTNGTTPTASSTKYTGPVTVSASETLEAIAVLSGSANSPAAIAAYSIETALPAPTFSVAAGSYAAPVNVSIGEATAGATIYYTTNGTTPTTASTKYTAAIEVTATETLKAIAVETGYNNSAVASSAYTINSSTATVAAPVFSVAGGAYVKSQRVTISDATSGASIFYTVNGTTPTASSTKYKGAITIATTETLMAIAEKTGATASAVTTATYTIGATVPAPAVSTAGGTYAASETVKLTDSKAGAIIYFTLDGTTPTTESTRYTEPIAIAETKTLKSIAVASGYFNSPIVTEAYTIYNPLPMPTLSVAAGTYTDKQTVTLKDSAPGAAIYYTTNGSTPTTSSTRYTRPILVSSTETIRAIAGMKGFKSSAVASANYIIKTSTATPALSVAAGTYASTQTVTLTDETKGAAIYYTTNGTTPTTASTKYAAPIKVTESETIKAIAVATEHFNSPVASAAYAIETAKPALSVAAGTYATIQTVTLSDGTSGATIYYTTNGTTPTTASTKYTAPIKVTESETVKAIAVAAKHVDSSVVEVAYAIQAAKPALSIAAGTYATIQTVTLSDGTSGATIYYTTNGTTPTTASTKYTAPIKVTESETVKAIAVAAKHVESSVVEVAYSIEAAKPALSVAAGTYATIQTVTLSDGTSGATIYYTTNGTTPTTASTKYTAPVKVTESETVKAIAVAAKHVDSSVVEVAYAIETATPAISVAAGAYTTKQTVTLTDGTSGAAIYYTTNGSTPTTASSKYSGKLTVAKSETIKAIAIAPAHATSKVATAAYSIAPAAASAPDAGK